MADDHDIADAAIQHGGWVAAALVATWGWITKKSLGDVGHALTRIENKVDRATEKIARLEGRLGMLASNGKDQ